MHGLQCRKKNLSPINQINIIYEKIICNLWKNCHFLKAHLNLSFNLNQPFCFWKHFRSNLYLRRGPVCLTLLQTFAQNFIENWLQRFRSLAFVDIWRFCKMQNLSRPATKESKTINQIAIRQHKASDSRILPKVQEWTHFNKIECNLTSYFWLNLIRMHKTLQRVRIKNDNEWFKKCYF